MNWLAQSFNFAGIRQTLKALSTPNTSYLLKPNLMVKSVRDLDFRRLHSQAGIRVLLMDKDNCWTVPYSPDIHPPLVTKWKECMSVFGTKNIYILSNSIGSHDDSSKLDLFHDVQILRHAQKKPEGGQELFGFIREKYERDNPGCQPLRPEHVCIFGDRLLTDVLMGRLNSWYSILIWDTIDTKRDNILAKWIRCAERRYLLRQGAKP